MSYIDVLSWIFIAGCVLLGLGLMITVVVTVLRENRSLRGRLDAEAPAADVAEERHGYWVKNKPNPEMMKQFHDIGIGRGMAIGSIFWTCSLCKTWGTPRYSFCPSCGARMDEKNG